MSSENFRLPFANGGLALGKLWPKESNLLRGISDLGQLILWHAEVSNELPRCKTNLEPVTIMVGLKIF